MNTKMDNNQNETKKQIELISKDIEKTKQEIFYITENAVIKDSGTMRYCDSLAINERYEKIEKYEKMLTELQKILFNENGDIPVYPDHQ